MRAEFKESIDNLAARIDELAEMMKMFSAQSRASSFSSQLLHPNNARCNGK